MENEKKPKRESIFKYFLKMILVFLVLDGIMMLVANLLTTSSVFYKYGSDLLTEMFYALAVLVVMLLFKNSYVFTNKKSKFLDGIKLAVPILLFSCITLVQSITSLNEFDISRFLNVLIFSIFIGIAEEFLCRGWLQNEFIERYSDNKKNVISSIILASLVFGLMHIINVETQTIFETILQVINATAVGVLFGSIYYKTKNIWSVIFLHAFYDFSIFLGEMNLVKDCTYNTPTIGITVVSCISVTLLSLLWILNGIYVLKKTNFPDKKSSKRKDINTLKLLIAITFILVLLPYENFAKEDYEDYEVCYNYEKISLPNNYTIHIPRFNSYNIEKIVETEENTLNVYNYRYQVNLEYGEVKIKNLNTNYEITLDFNNIINIEVLESNNKFLLVFLGTDNESTVYYSDYITRMNMSDDDSYLDNLKETFKKYELPEIVSLGYITPENNIDVKYPYVSSYYYDYFMIKEGSLYLIDNQ